jgi:hypothetical protein
MTAGFHAARNGGNNLFCGVRIGNHDVEAVRGFVRILNGHVGMLLFKRVHEVVGDDRQGGGLDGLVHEAAGLGHTEQTVHLIIIITIIIIITTMTI